MLRQLRQCGTDHPTWACNRVTHKTIKKCRQGRKKREKKTMVKGTEREKGWNSCKPPLKPHTIDTWIMAEFIPNEETLQALSRPTEGSPKLFSPFSSPSTGTASWERLNPDRCCINTEIGTKYCYSLLVHWDMRKKRRMEGGPSYLFICYSMVLRKCMSRALSQVWIPSWHQEISFWIALDIGRKEKHWSCFIYFHLPGGLTFPADGTVLTFFCVLI